MTPGPIVTSKAKDAFDMFHNSSALHSPRRVFASVNLPIFPPRLVCTLHPFFQALMRLPLTIHGALEDPSKGNLCRPVLV